MPDNQTILNERSGRNFALIQYIDIHILYYLTMLSEFYQRRGEFISLS